MFVVVTVPKKVLIVEDSMSAPSFEDLVFTEVITCVISAVDVLTPSVVSHLNVGVGGEGDIGIVNGNICSRIVVSVSELPSITAKNTLLTLVKSVA